MKFLQFAFLFAAFSVFAYADNHTWGDRTRADFLLMSELVCRNAIPYSHKVIDIRFPKAGQTNNRTITAIYVTDNYYNGRGAIANLWSGGPESKFATIKLTGKSGEGINSTVEFYGI